MALTDCKKVKKTTAKLKAHGHIYERQMHVVDTLKPCVKEIFGVYKQNMTFGEMSNYSD